MEDGHNRKASHFPVKLNQVFLPNRFLNLFIQDEHQFTGLVGRGRFYNELLYTCTLCKLNIASKLIQSCTSLSNDTKIAKSTLFFYLQIKELLASTSTGLIASR